MTSQDPAMTAVDASTDPEREAIDFDGRSWVISSAQVATLEPGGTGVWAVRTLGTTYVLGLDTRRFMRCPGASSRAGAMPFDHVALPFTRIQVLPSVGGHLHLWFDDPRSAGPALVEHFRISSTVQQIAAMASVTGRASARRR